MESGYSGGDQFAETPKTTPGLIDMAVRWSLWGIFTPFQRPQPSDPPRHSSGQSASSRLPTAASSVDKALTWTLV